jgi:thiol-disulfide isomerase/thioredoxin
MSTVREHGRTIPFRRLYDAHSIPRRRRNFVGAARADGVRGVRSARARAAGANSIRTRGPGHAGGEPGVTYKDLDGKAFTVDELPGSVKVINFWATWCAPCIKEIPSFNKLHAKYESKGVTFVGVSVDEQGKEVVEPFLKTPKGKIAYRVALATLEDLKAVDVTERIPVTLVYNKSGAIVKRFDGFAEESALESAIQAAMTSSAD